MPRRRPRSARGAAVRVFALLLALLLTPSTAGAAERAYVLVVAGVEVARVRLTQTVNDGGTSLDLTVKNKGLARLFAGETETRMTAEVALDPPLPRAFDAIYTKPDRTREIVLRYEPDGEIRALTLKSQGREQDSEVAPEDQAGTVDPLTALVRVQAWLASEPKPGAETVLPVFDGRKRYDVRLRHVDEDAEHRPRVQAAIVGRVGFEPDDALVSMPGTPPTWLDVTFDKGPHPLPRSVEGENARLEVE